MSDFHYERQRITDLERRVATLEASLAGALREIEILKVSAEPHPLPYAPIPADLKTSPELLAKIEAARNPWMLEGEI